MGKLALGTVQFGLNYGVANRTGQVSFAEASAILSRAARHGVDTLDTAIAYGESERRLGEFGVANWRVISKLPPLPRECSNVRAWVSDCLAGSLKRLNRDRLQGLLLHRALDLQDARGDDLYAALIDLKKSGLVEKIGVSIYNPEDLLESLRRFHLDLVQAPYNIVDRRFSTTGCLARLHGQGVEVHVRSVFLQGLLLMNDAQRPPRFTPFEPLWRAWREWLREVGLTPLQACLRFVLSQPEISRVVVGVDRDAQLQEILAAATDAPIDAPASLISCDPMLINPLSWITT